MADRWEEFAKKDAEFYIYSVDVDYRTPDGIRFFFETGEADSQKILTAVQGHMAKMGTALEIGCGTGRILSAMASRFQRVVGVDISPTMLNRLRENFERMGLGEVSAYLPTEAWGNEGPDLVYSYLVFQHIESIDVIADYVQRVSACLGDGVFFAQFDTRPATLDYKVRRALPDFLLPRTLRRGIRRVRRSPSDLMSLFTDAGLRLVAETGAGTAEHFFVLKKSHSSAGPTRTDG